MANLGQSGLSETFFADGHDLDSLFRAGVILLKIGFNILAEAGELLTGVP